MDRVFHVSRYVLSVIFLSYYVSPVEHFQNFIIQFQDNVLRTRKNVKLPMKVSIGKK